MKIDKFEIPKGTTIKDLNEGDCFTFLNSDTVFMKILAKDIHNVVSMKEGMLCSYSENTKIIPLPEATVTFPKVKKPKEEVKEWYDYTFKEIKLNHCNQRFGCNNCPIAYACKEHLMVEELMEALDDILDE